MRRLLLLLALVALAAPGSPAAAAPQGAVDVPSGRLDLNRATLEQIEALPVPAELARAIWEYREYRSWFDDFYELREVEGMTAAHLAALAPRVATLPPPGRDEALERYDASFRQVQQFLSQEGASQELADEYLDLLRDPQNINQLSLYDLMGFQNVSPVDAVAIVQARERAGTIEDTRALRNAQGLGYWAYRNLRDYVVFEEPAHDWELHGDLQVLSYNSPYRLDDSDALTEINNREIRGLGSLTPAVGTKLRLRTGTGFKGGVMQFRNVGEEELDETFKGFVEYRPPTRRGSVRLDRVVLGNFRVAFGQGLVMDNTDYFLPRKTGYGWNKRPMGILGDLSRSHEYQLTGAAVEFSLGRLHGIGFASHDTRDGVLNADGSINRYINMEPRLTDAELAALADSSAFSGRIARDAFDETVLGGNLKFELFPGTYLGLSAYESQYDRPVNPDVISLFARPDLLEGRDAELFADYDSRPLGDFRRVVGSEFQAVYENVALQGEYAKLDASQEGGLSGLLSGAPEAWLVNGYVQYGDLNVLGLYRDYDLGFDNPYARGFSQDSRYEQTLLGDPFRLSDPLLSWIELNNPQMKAERGFHLSTRYRINRKWTISGLDYDQWERVADGQDQRRLTARVEYAPIFPLRFRVRHRFSSRGEAFENDERRFKSWDTRLEARVRLSGYDELRLLYSATNTQFASRPRLSGPSEPGSPTETALAQAASPGHALQAQLQHNVNPSLMFTFSSLVYDGFLWNFEDNEFVALDGQGFRHWVMVRSRVSDRLLVRAKFTHDRYRTRTNVGARNFDNEVEDPLLGIGRNVRGSENSFRMQLDYTF